MHNQHETWLHDFERSCGTLTPNDVYKSLVMMGVSKPDSGSCDCLNIIEDCRDRLARRRQDIRDFWRTTPNRARILKDIAVESDSIEMYTSFHREHGEYNRRIHETLVRSHMLAKVRAALLRDLRDGVRVIYDDGEGGTIEYCRVALKSHALALRDFLVANPKGWF